MDIVVRYMQKEIEEGTVSVSRPEKQIIFDVPNPLQFLSEKISLLKKEGVSPHALHSLLKRMQREVEGVSRK